MTHQEKLIENLERENLRLRLQLQRAEHECMLANQLIKQFEENQKLMTVLQTK